MKAALHAKRCFLKYPKVIVSNKIIFSNIRLHGWRWIAMHLVSWWFTWSFAMSKACWIVRNGKSCSKSCRCGPGQQASVNLNLTLPLCHHQVLKCNVCSEPFASLGTLYGCATWSAISDFDAMMKAIVAPSFPGCTKDWSFSLLHSE